MCYQDEDGTDSSLGTGSGNETSCFYRGTTDMLKLIEGKNSSFGSFNVLALRNYLNGTITYDSEKTTLLNGILDAAKSVSTTTEDTSSIANDISNTSTTNTSNEDQNVYLNFSINPQNNPTYSVSGYSINSSATNSVDGYVYYYTDSNMNISITPGLDETNISTSTVTIYYGIDSNSDGDLDDNGDSKNVLWTWNETIAKGIAEATGLSEADAATAVNNSPATYRYTVTSGDENTDALSCSISLSSSEIESGKKYLILVEGYDIDNQQIIESASNGYGFYAKTNVVAPSIIVGASSGYVNLGNSKVIPESVFTGTKQFGFSGTISSEIGRAHV